MIAQKNVDVEVGYGLGATCLGTFDRESLNGVSVRNAIRRVATTPQSTPESTRTAIVLQDVLGKNRLLDVEFACDPVDEAKPVKSVKLDDPLLNGGTDGTGEHESQEISLLVSEPYRGGINS